MATESEHKRQAEHNQEFLSTIDPNRFPDWIATVAFYTAVHLVEQLFAHESRPAGGSHLNSNSTLKRDYPELWKEYRPLYAFSRMGRYWCMAVDPVHVSYVKWRLGRVEQIINTLLAK